VKFLFDESKFWKNFIIGVILGVLLGFIAFFVALYGIETTNFFGLVDPLLADYSGPLLIISSFISILVFFMTILLYFFMKREKNDVVD
jgi:hypothetical protein